MPFRRGHEKAACQLEYSKTKIVLVVDHNQKLYLVRMHPIPSLMNLGYTYKSFKRVARMIVLL